MKAKIILFLLAQAFFAPMAFSQDDVSAVNQGGLEGFFAKAGPIGMVIMLLSVVAMTLIIKEVLEIRKQKLAPPEIVDEIEALLEAEEYQEAMEVCESEPCYFTNVVAAGLPKLNASFEAMEKSLEEMMEEENTKLYGRLSWLSLIAAVAPMMGLLGTVQGMINAFEKIAATKGQATPDQLAKDISMALITTMLGLTVAIPVTAAYVFLRNRVVAYSLEISAVIEDMFERFRPRSS
jgi:biopolymer transport protein ExbB